MTASDTDWPVSRRISGMSCSACLFALILALGACNDPTDIGEQETDSDSGTGEPDSTSGGVGPSTSGAASGSSVTTTASAGSAGSDTSGEETGQIEPPDGSNVIFLNFYGVILFGGTDNAPADTSSAVSGDLSPYQSPLKITEIVASVEAAWSGINVVFVTERPADGDFTMVVITPTLSNGYPEGVQGVSGLDCENTNPNSTGVVFTHSSPDAATIAFNISRMLGQTYGLEPVNADSGFMNSDFMLATEFTDACNSTFFQPQECPHIGCAGGEQNSYAELVSRLAARE